MNELIIIEDEGTLDIGYPIASILTMERAMEIVRESKDWPLPWEEGWKQMYVQGKVVPRKMVKQGRRKK